MASTAPQEFMFVDFHRDNASTRKARQIFAQNTYQRKKRLAAVERLKTSTTQRLRQRLPFRYAAARDEDRRPSEGPATNPRHPHPQENNLQIARSRSRASWAEFVSPKTLLGQGFVDPFSTSAVPMSDIMNSYFHHLRTFTIQQSYPLDAPRMKIWWWQKALSEPAIQQALLVSAASHQTALNTLAGVSPQYMRSSVREFLRLRGDTIKTLNGKLRDPGAVAESTILIVASLRAIEAISASVEGVTAHTTGLEVLINLHGGLDALEHLTVSKIYHGDIIRAALTDTPPLPLSPKWRAEILQGLKLFSTSTGFLSSLADLDPTLHNQLSHLGTSFLNAPWLTTLPPTLQTTLVISQRLVAYYEAAQVDPSLIKPTDNDLFVVLMHRLVADTYKDTVHEPLRLCLLVYLNMRVWHLQSFPIMACLVGMLRGSLLSPSASASVSAVDVAVDVDGGCSVLSHLQSVAPDLLFWILFIGGMASHGHSGHSWFLGRLAECASRLGFGLEGDAGWADVRGLLGGFFYTDQKGEVLGEEVWGDVLGLIQATATAASVKSEGVSGGGGACV
ncbi:uncharacterized protein DSM5745_10499 [Aspergillus mulundensis]|uniref:Tachykinin family protein n=1 Tax=Aspergillus mulundensis TaxID=1810919 RepID=A0A3D8QJA3_9EURO|nr:hypothetical protein DSM5745_10499 [Aspergillus mulundensis]RDW61827.1 hypothetical protein DSM5745_10499 [Aspergillus mulundensis]